MKGLSSRKTAEAIASFVKSHGAEGPRRAVLCTYDIQPARFESVVLPELTRRQRWFRTLVLGDAAALQKDGVLSQRSAASSYELSPVRLSGPGVFHPKLIVLQAGEHVLVGVGSGNLTAGGLGGNLELMLFATNDTADGRALAESALQFLNDLRNATGVVMPPSAKRFLDRVCVASSRSKGGPLLHSLDEPLINQFAAGRPAQTRRTIVVSPWHSSSASSEGVEPAVLRELKNVFGVLPVVHTEGENGKGPALGKDVRVRVLEPTTRDSNEDLDEDEPDDSDRSAAPRRRATLHSKAYVAVGKSAATLWFGSANCTAPALLRSANREGNVELLLRVALEKRGLAAFEADLASMFDDSNGVLQATQKARIPAARGCILSGYATHWGQQPSITLELVGPTPKKRTLRIARSATGTTHIDVSVPARDSSVILNPMLIARLLGEPDAPSVLWEHVGDTPVPFPVSVSWVPPIADPEEALDDLLNELAGRMPAVFSSLGRRGRPDEIDGPRYNDDDEDESDLELALLSKTEHQGRFDRIAVRVELLRRRLETVTSNSSEAQAHYKTVINQLNLAPTLRRILVEHLGERRSAR